MAKVVVLGSITIDRQVQDGQLLRTQLGGVPFYAAAAIADAGADVVAISSVGNRYAEEVAIRLRGLGIVATLQRGPTMTTVENHILGDGERDVVITETAPCVSWATVAQVPLRDAAVVHLGPVHAQDICREVLGNVKDLAATVSLDLQGYVRSAGPGRVSLVNSPMLSEALAAATVVKATKAELRNVLAPEGLDAHGLIRKFAIRELVITDGKRGGSVITMDGRTFSYQAAAVSRYWDATGAGDVFIGRYVVGRVLGGLRVADACTTAAAAAARQIAGQFVVQRPIASPMAD